MALRRGIYGLLLFLQAGLILTGGAVRLTASGLGCPTWPECTPGSYTPVPNQAEGALHAWIEFGNRLLTFGLVAISLIVLAHVLFTKRRDLRVLAAGQLLGILGQGVLGGITVLTDLHPLPVAGHLLLSIFLVAAAVSLYDRREAPIERIKQSDSLISLLSKSHIALTFIVIVLGTLVTGSGPHAGDAQARRFGFDIRTVAILHADAIIALFGLTLALAVALRTNKVILKKIYIFTSIALAQGAIGYIQYFTGIPEILVAAHLLGATLVWIAAWRIRLVFITTSTNHRKLKAGGHP
ncbi:MAG: heme A synthase [Candidatus Planktophila sp.]|nr:heme A synthase [Candidatus Planktophila sp.]